MQINKLVRDKIPQIIENNNQKATFKILDSDQEYLSALNQKLQEELDEYYASGKVEELADLAEVLLAILKLKQISQNEFENIMAQKRENRGAFENRVFLIH